MALAAPAFAQAAPEAAAEADDSSVIVVTGSRIANPNLTSASPVTAVSSAEVKLSGNTRVEDLLNSLPQVVAGQNANTANGATGTATVDLRGLGPSRTLVLINGRRLMTGDPNTTSSAADLNFIPSSLIKRVDVLTGGASATYGADAVAGVVNFVLDTDFEGFRIDSNYGVNQHKNRNKTTPPLLDARANAGFAGFGYPKGNVVDGGNFDTTISFGTSFDDGRGKAVAYVGYRKTRPVTQDRRDYSACTIQVNDGLAGGFTPNAPLQCGGSLTNRTGTAIFYTNTTSSSTVGTFGPGVLNKGVIDRYNFAPANHFQRPDERYTAGVFADYEISEAIHPYMEFMFMDDRTVAQIAESGDFGNTLTINCDNPLMSAQQRGLICNQNNLIVGNLGTFPLATGLYQGIFGTAAPGPINYVDPTTGATYNKAFLQLLRRNVEGGKRINDLQHTQFRTVIGTRGDLGKGWAYDAYYQYGRVNYSQVYRNEFSTRRLGNALDAVMGPGGTAVCRSVLTGADPNCVPYDIFSGNISQGALDYLSADGFLKGQTSQQVLSGQLTGELGEYGFKTPWSDTGVSLALGAEYRKDSLELNADNAFSTGDLTGQGAPTKSVAGSYNVKELFTEVNVPIVKDGFIYELSVDGAYRYSKYKTSNGRGFKTDTWKVEGIFAPIRDVSFRATYAKAARVPNIQELFAPQIIALDGVTDLCAGFEITAADTGCLAQGLRVGQTVTANPAQQYNGLIGGTPTLNPEKSTTKSFGVLVQPRVIPNFSLSVDYFDIKVTDFIQGFGADAIQASCVNDNNLDACALIHRNPAGSLWLTPDGFVDDLSLNVGGIRTKGYEINANYAHDIGAGRLSLRLFGTLLDSYEVDNGLTDLYDCKGYYGPTCGNPLPKWRHTARATYQMENGIGVSLNWRYLSSVKVEYANPSTSLAGPFYDFDAKIKAQSYFDLAFTVDIGNKFTWRIGANNIMDKQPPLVASGSGNFGASACASVACNGNTYPGTYDVLGRYLYTGITLNF
ncbi:TonB-dependent receptor [Sphingomonas sp. Root710]|nr:TonB-dependent receptor [Sphingomonas sp. Root710]